MRKRQSRNTIVNRFLIFLKDAEIDGIPMKIEFDTGIVRNTNSRILGNKRVVIKKKLGNQ